MPGVPTASDRQSKAAAAVVGNEPEGAQMHSGEHVASPTATCKM